jgi:hypothetical protein
MRTVVLFLGRNSLWMVVASVLCSMSAYFFIDAEDASIALVFIRFGIPFVLAIIVAGLCYMDGLKAQCDTDSKYWVSLLAVSLFMAMSAPGWLLWANAVLPPQEHFVLTGFVKDKKVTYYKNTPKSWITISGYPEDIQIPEITYSRLRIGDTFRQLRYRGPLGISYVWEGDSLANQSPDPASASGLMPAVRGSFRP